MLGAGDRLASDVLWRGRPATGSFYHVDDTLLWMQQQAKCAVLGHACHVGLFARNLFVGQRIQLAGVAHQRGFNHGQHDGTRFLTTLTFLFSTPGWEPSLGGFPALSAMPGQFVLKDIVLLAAALWSFGEALREAW